LAEEAMPRTNLKEQLIENIEDLPEKQVKEVIDFVSYLKIREDKWFIDFVNRRSMLAKSEKKAGKTFHKLENLRKEYR
jgi:hypothetical protein